MTLTILSLLACGGSPSSPTSTPAPAFAGMTIPVREADGDRASKNGHLAHTVDGVAIDVRYGRPEVRDRTVFGDLVPYGKVWRTGANEATTLALAEAVRIDSADVEAGVYAMFTIPYESEWIVVLNREADQWGASSYDRSRDAVRIAVRPETAEFTETFTIEGTDRGIQLRWADVAVPLKIAAAGPRDAEGRRRVQTPAAP